MALLTALMLALGWAARVYNLDRACTLRQWPELASCTNRANDAPAQSRRLGERIARNPGDSEAAIQLAMLSSQPGKAPGVNHDAALDTAAQLAGEDYRVQRMQAVRAIGLKQWPQAVNWLVRLVQDSSDGPAALTLAALVREPQALAAMQTHIKPGASWLEPLIGAMQQAGVPVVLAMPLVVRALPQQGLSPELTQRLLGQLKAEGQWLEAHALWTAWLGRPADLVFNGNFDQGFIAGGFDWEITPVAQSKAGALVRQVALDKHGGVLQVEFTGRPIAVPVVRQPLVLLHTRFVFSGQFMSSQLRTNDGLAWVLQCVSGNREIARTPALKSTGGHWQTFKVEVDLPPDCGQAVALQLQTFSPYEALAGLQGQILFDDFKLEGRP
ncbi:MAG: hypothetical protein ABI845_07980 [Polaromonas sp.]